MKIDFCTISVCIFNFVTYEGPDSIDLTMPTNAAANLVQLSTLSNSRCSSPEETELPLPGKRCNR